MPVNTIPFIMIWLRTAAAIVRLKDEVWKMEIRNLAQLMQETDVSVHSFNV